ncbi:hypothetical protein F8388_015542 [Cannabis sativa]|uniref:Uncharacterized protein n=1 Tax=Cannabis sativa TaxID=3483 RepID=A0A7J6GIF2_CANSA|nr:hypothetical protein F8388_015542 [Cannabis sativa]
MVRTHPNHLLFRRFDGGLWSLFLREFLHFALAVLDYNFFFLFWFLFQRTEVGEERFLDSSLDSYPDINAEALLVISGSAKFSFVQGVTKLVKACGPRSLMAALSYTMGASSAVSYVPNQSRWWRRACGAHRGELPKMNEYFQSWQLFPLDAPLVNSYHKLSDLPEIDCMLITQSLDDHCHLKTLNLLSAKYPNLRIRVIVAAAIDAPVVDTTMFGALAVLIGSVGKWCNINIDEIKKKLKVFTETTESLT